MDGSLTYTGEPRLSPTSLDGVSGNVEDRTSPSSKQPQLHSGVSGSHDDIWAGLSGVHHEPVAVAAAVVPVPVRVKIWKWIYFICCLIVCNPQEGATSVLRDAIKQGGFDICLTVVSIASETAVAVDVAPANVAQEA